MTAVEQELAELAASMKKPTNVIEALARVASELPGIAKTRDPSGGVKYAFRGIEVITQEVAPLFAKYGIVFAPQVTSWERDQITVNGNPWTDDRITVRYSIYGPGGRDDYIDVTIPGVGRDNSDKGTNKALTQAFKYALLQVLCICDSKDDADGQTHEADAVRHVSDEERAEVAAIQALADKVKQHGLGQQVKELELDWPWNRAARAQIEDLIDAYLEEPADVEHDGTLI